MVGMLVCLLLSACGGTSSSEDPSIKRVGENKQERPKGTLKRIEILPFGEPCDSTLKSYCLLARETDGRLIRLAKDQIPGLSVPWGRRLWLDLDVTKEKAADGTEKEIWRVYRRVSSRWMREDRSVFVRVNISAPISSRCNFQLDGDTLVRAVDNDVCERLIQAMNQETELIVEVGVKRLMRVPLVLKSFFLADGVDDATLRQINEARNPADDQEPASQTRL